MPKWTPAPIALLVTIVLGSALVAGAMLLWSDRAENKSQPTEPATVDEGAAAKAEICAVLTERLPEACPGLGVRAAKCIATDGSVALSVGQREGKGVSSGYLVRFGGSGPQWYVDAERDVWTANSEAVHACPGMLAIEDLVRMTARAAAEALPIGDATACSVVDIAVAEDIAKRLDAVNGAISRGLLDVKDAERAAIRDAATVLELGPEQVAATWAKVVKLCPEVL